MTDVVLTPEQVRFIERCVSSTESARVVAPRRVGVGTSLLAIARQCAGVGQVVAIVSTAARALDYEAGDGRSAIKLLTSGKALRTVLDDRGRDIPNPGLIVVTRDAVKVPNVERLAERLSPDLLILDRLDWPQLTEESLTPWTSRAQRLLVAAASSSSAGRIFASLPELRYDRPAQRSDVEARIVSYERTAREVAVYDAAVSLIQETSSWLKGTPQPQPTAYLSRADLQAAVLRIAERSGTPDIQHRAEEISDELDELGSDAHVDVLLNVLSKVTGPVLILCSTLRSASYVSSSLAARGVDALELTGAVPRAERSVNWTESSAVVATDAAFESLDIPLRADIVWFDAPTPRSVRRRALPSVGPREYTLTVLVGDPPLPHERRLAMVVDMLANDAGFDLVD